MTAARLVAVVGPGVLRDARTAEEVFTRALTARGAVGEFVVTSTEQEFSAAVADAVTGGEFLLLLPADPADLDAQVRAGLPLHGAAVVRVDLDERDVGGTGPDRSEVVRRHVRGRGVDGLRFAVDAWHCTLVSPARTVVYGDDPDQRGELRVPDGPGPFPVAVLVHGGYWRSRWENDLSEPMAVDLLTRGFATWNVEYRRPAEAGWNGTAADVAASLEVLADLDERLDLNRVVTLGHSAGGQLVVRLAADVAADPSRRVRPALTVSQAGVLDLVTADRRWLGEGAVSTALGGRADDIPAVYAESSPLQRIPIGLPLAVVVGRGDNLDLLELSRAFVSAAAAGGDEVTFVEDEGNHFSVIDPRTGIWERTVQLLRDRLGSTQIVATDPESTR
ncbi:alpha/beta hydrolase family protein [Kineococcus sp. SYSU DK003]|uniref:alpha/beta hydrolase family protein n=1 Tax=Kineococcus sp. SYSU DK003 TaxID=3383124 RepID=UPI003D7F0284